MRAFLTFAAIVLLLMGARTAPLHAQAQSDQPAATGLQAAAAVQPAPAGATFDMRAAHGAPTAPAALRLDLPAELRPAAAAEASVHEALRRDTRRGFTWVAVGGALIVAGMFIDGDAGAAVSIGGAVIGAYGVYLIARQ